MPTFGICIDVIDKLETFQAVRSNWDLVYEADPQARFFLSWIWQSGMLKRYDEQHNVWFILAAKSSAQASDYVAFFPLIIGIDRYPSGSLYNKLSMAGVADSEHIGFICLPDYEEAVAVAFAGFLQQQEEWSIFQMQHIPRTDQRLDLFLESFSGKGFEFRESRHISDLDQIDNNIVPYVSLPDTWEQYLQTAISSNTRQKLKRFLRKVEDSDTLHLTQVNADNFERHLEILLGFWKTSWEGRKEPDLCRRILNYFSFTIRHCFENRCLWLPVLWEGDKPLGAIANLMDFSHKTVLFFVGGRDETIKDLPSGIILHTYGIQYAIQNGFKVYDFLMGNEAYKFSFGAKERQIKMVALRRENSTNLNPKLDVRTIQEAFQISAYYHRANRLVEAERAYRQVLDVQPQHPGALYGLGVVLQRQGDYLAAKDSLTSLLQVQPNDAKAWFSLGVLHQTQNQLPEAEKAYRQALTLQPESLAISLAISHNLGYTLQQQGNWEEAIACYQKARELQPDSIEAEVILANALYAQGTLASEKRAHYATMNHDLGNRRKQADDLKTAIEYYRQAIAMNPSLAEAHYHLGLGLQEQDQDNWEEAIACYQRARELQPDYIEAEVRLANTLYAQGTFASENQAHYATMNYDLGNKCKQADNLKAATEYYRQAITLNSDLAEAHYHLGLALQAQSNWEEAIACYQKAWELQPDYTEAELGLANVLHAQRKLSPEDRERYAAMNYKLGNKYKQSGDLKVAVEYYQQATTMNPDLTEVRDHLRLALEEQNNIKIKVSCAKR